MNNKKVDYYAFFDVDGTLVRENTMLSFLKFFHQKTSVSLLIGNFKYLLCKLRLSLLLKSGINREFLNRFYYKFYKNKDTLQVKELGCKWFDELEQAPSFYLNNVVEKMKEHQTNGGEIVLVSGSFNACLKPLAEKFNIKHILATRLEIRNNQYTGKILVPQTIGEGKARAIRDFLKEKDFSDLKKCFAYGDHSSDIHMLSLVGNPKVISGEIALEKHAKCHGWEILFN